MRFRLLILAILFSGSLAARADVNYTIMIESIAGPLVAGTFSFHEPSILTSFTAIPHDAITTSGVAVNVIIVDPLALGCPLGTTSPTAVSCVELDYTSGARVELSFPVPLTSLKAYGGPTGPGFSITSTDATVPEPSTYLLLGTGIAGLAGMVPRRRFLS